MEIAVTCNTVWVNVGDVLLAYVPLPPYTAVIEFEPAARVEVA
jgi:hypothetical protein